MKISSKQRIRAAVEHRQTDKVPTFSSFTPRLTDRLRKELDIAEPDIGVALGNDMIQAGATEFATKPILRPVLYGKCIKYLRQGGVRRNARADERNVAMSSLEVQSSFLPEM